MSVFLLCFFFIFGAIVGSLLNVCIYRIPLEKSILWPGSRCGACLQAIRWYNNIPLVSYLVLGGRCRHCHSRFSARYFLVELLTGICFAGLFYLEVTQNIFHIPEMEAARQRMAWHSFPTWQSLVFPVYHGVLVSFLIVVTFCDLDHREIPISVTITGTVVGLIGATLFPWPWPGTAARIMQPNQAAFSLAIPQPVLGLYPWPPWQPLPAWLPPGSWQLGLATGVVGLLVGTLMLRAVRFLFSTGLGVEALGLGDADLMMMAGSFLGWQPLIVAFFISVIPGLLFALAHLAYRWHIAHSRRTIELNVGLKEMEVAVEVDGKPVVLENLGPTLSRMIHDEKRKRVLFNPGDLEAAAAHAVAQAEEAAHQAGLRASHLEAEALPPSYVSRLFGFLSRFVRSKVPAVVLLEVLPKDGAAGYKLDGQDTVADQLYPRLREFAKDKSDLTVNIDSHALDKWLDRTLGHIRLIVREAGVETIYRRDNAIPFGPSLAVGLVVSLLAWPWFVARGNLALLFFNSTLIFGLAGGCAFIMLAASYAIRMVRLMRQ